MLQSMIGSEERESMSGLGKTVCVTGASGFIASWLVKFLLLRGYTVKASVRDPGDQKKIEHLLALDGAKEKLHLFKADLLKEGSFDSVVDGCEGVFHTASPCFTDLKDKDPQAEMIEPAVKGTLNVLASCAKTPCVRRVILTSSISATVYTGQPRTRDVVLDETWYSKPEICKEMKLWYQLAKTLAEDAAWKFVKEKGIDMIAINPGMVIGPSLQPTLNLSAGIILNFVKGSKTFPNHSMGWVNIKDVVNAHIHALDIPSASGRYVLAERVLHYSEIVEILHKQFPALQLPLRCADDKPFVPTYQISQTKARTLGIDFIPMEESIREIVESLKEQGFLNF